MFVLLLDYSTVSQEWDRQEIASAHTDDSLDGQTRALAHFAHFPPFHVTRHHGPTLISADDWKHQTELARVHLKALLEDYDGSRNQPQEETEEVMSLVVT